MAVNQCCDTCFYYVREEETCSNYWSIHNNEIRYQTDKCSGWEPFEIEHVECTLEQMGYDK